ncbi:MAG TPA: carboxypeptidase regulatory-like domain-containing protein, partial [Terracidiphilus sp.]|nr:carboxypeptidase regulatory-like domain-containing protein [Terracidiphilus sp.]
MKRFLPVTVMFAVALFVAALSGPASYAQNSRGSITGQVTDATGAVVPGAEVTVTSTDTGAATKVKTSGDGFYTAPALLPGGYKVSVSAPGFSIFNRTGIQLHTQENATINVKLQVGSTSAVVTVTAAAPLIDTADASTGQVLTTQEVQDLPTNGGSPLGFARIEYGTVVKAKHALGGATPVSNSTVDDFSLGGGNSSSNELLLNGVPNMQDSGRTAAFSPQLDSVNEVRVDVFGANAMYGDTSGGTVNITTRSGTNQFHGSARWQYEDSGCSGLDGKFQSRLANHCTWMTALPYSQQVGNNAPPSSHLNQFGGTIGGPVAIPHVFNGRNKLFFFYAYETMRGAQPPAQTIGTVPTAAERNGDFSALLALNDSKHDYTLYNPNSATGSTSGYTRTAIPGNVFSNAGLSVSPIAKAYLKLVPLPNYSGPTTTADGENNYFTYTPMVQDYRSHMGRLDYNIGANDKIFGEAHRSRYLNQQSNYFHNSLTGTNSDQIMFGSQIEEVHTFSPTMFLDVRGSLSRYDNSNFVSSSGISPSTLGFPGYLAQNATTLALPRIDFTDQTNPLSYSNQPGSFENFDTLQWFTNLTKVWRSHTFQGGVDLRAYKGSYLTPGYADGQFSFANSAGNAVSSGYKAPAPYFGSAFALFMLGIPTGGQEAIGAPFQYNSFLNAIFLQDDWKARPNWTVSMGVRFEHEIPVNESQNRMVIGFDPAATNEATAAAAANYAKSPSPLLA